MSVDRVAAHALAPRRARVRGDPHHARGRRRARAAGAALLGRQGLDRAAAARREGVPAGQVPVPGHARRHRAQLPRGDRVPRPPRRRARRAAVVASVQESIDKGRVVEQTGPRASRNQLQTTTLLDAIEEHGFDAAMGGARRDEERARAKERIFSFRDDFGQWNPRAQRPELWNLYNAPHPQGRAHPRLPDLELDGARRVAVHRPRAARAAVDLLRARARGLPPRRDALRRLRLRRAAARRGAVHGVGALPHGRRHDAAPAASSRTRRRSTRSSPRSRRRSITERGETRADDRVSRGRDGGPEARWLLLSYDDAGRAAAPRHRGLGRRRQVDADRPAALRHEADPRRPARAHRGDLAAPRRRLRQPRAAHRRPARRARAGDHDRRRLPLVRHAAAPLPARRRARGTSSTRATWSPAPRPRTWR